MTEELELAFDERRVRTLTHWHKAHRDLRVFDGQRAVAHDEYYTHSQESFVLRPEPQEFFAHVGSSLSWPRVGDPQFWFVKQDYPAEVRAQFNGLPQDYERVGEENVGQHRCYVLENRQAQRRLHIGTVDRRLYRITLFILDREVETKAALEKAAGRKFTNMQEKATWEKRLSKEELSAFARRLNDEYFPLKRPWVIHNLNDYREVVPGLWIPFEQGYSFVDRAGKATSTRQLKLVDARANEPLDDALFKVELKEGVQVADYMHDPPLFYKFKADRTPEEFQAIVDEHKRDNGAWQKQKAIRDELVGTQAPDLPKRSWFNSAELDWTTLKGKLVVLDFWSTSCGPCLNDLPHVEALHNERDSSGIVAIGVHTSAGEASEITEIAKQRKLTYPIVVDLPAEGHSGFGRLFKQLGVNAIPYTYLIDRDGRIAAHGSLHEVLSKARELAAEENAEK